MTMRLSGKTIDDLCATLWNGRTVSMRSYLAGIRQAKAEPDSTFRIGYGCDATGAEIVERHRAMLDKAITERGPHAGERGIRNGRSWEVRSAERIMRRVRARLGRDAYGRHERRVRLAFGY